MPSFGYIGEYLDLIASGLVALRDVGHTMRTDLDREPLLRWETAYDHSVAATEVQEHLVGAAARKKGETLPASCEPLVAGEASVEVSTALLSQIVIA
jgi:hypothetical protein